MRKALTVGFAYTGDEIDAVEIENLGLCRRDLDHDHAALPLYEYDAIIINPESYTHFLFGKAGEFSNKPNELELLKKQNPNYDFGTIFDREERCKEMEGATALGTNVVWCLSNPKRVNFFGYRETHLGFAAPMVEKFAKNSGFKLKNATRTKHIDPDSPFVNYFHAVAQFGGWYNCLTDPGEDFASIATTPEGYSLGGQVTFGTMKGWLLTQPWSEEAKNQLVRDCLALNQSEPTLDQYHSVFLSYTSDDKDFVRKLREDLLSNGVKHVWLDEFEINVGDSLIAKIEEGMKRSKYIAVVLSKKSINAPWVKREMEIAFQREIKSGEIVVLPLLIEKCELPGFLEGKLYADFTQNYEAALDKLLRRLQKGDPTEGLQAGKEALHESAMASQPAPSPLQAPLAHGRDPDIMHEKIQAASRINARNSEGISALHRVAFANATDAVLALIKLGADLDACDQFGMTPLHHAAVGNASEAARCLVNAGADINSRDDMGLSALHRAAVSNAPEAIRALIELGAKINSRDEENATPLHHAADGNAADAARTLIGVGASVDACDNSRSTPLHHAAIRNAPEVANILIDAGANMEAQDRNGTRPLQLAIYLAASEAACELIEAGAETRVLDRTGLTLLQLAEAYNAPKIVRALIDSQTKT